MAIVIAGSAPVDWDYQLGPEPIFFGGQPPNVAIDSAGVTWAMKEIDGWDSADLKRAEFDNPFAHGSTPGPAFLAARQLAGTGMLVAPNNALLEDAQERLRAALPINTDVPLVANETIPKYLYVRRSGRILFSQLGQFPNSAATFSIGMTAYDPRKYALLDQSVQINSAFATGGASWPITWPVTWTSPSSVSIGELSNNGDLPAPVKVTLTGPLSAPTLLDRVSGYRLGLNLELQDGEQVTVDTELGTALLGDDSVFTALDDPLLPPWYIPPGGIARVVLLAYGTGHATCSVSDCWE